jgi:hypothetical protein
MAAPPSAYSQAANHPTAKLSVVIWFGLTLVGASGWIATWASR